MKSKYASFSVIPKKRAAVALETGDVVLLDISSRSDLVHLHTYHTTEKCHAATALCILDDQMFVGTEAGAIMRVPLVKSSKPSYLARVGKREPAQGNHYRSSPRSDAYKLAVLLSSLRGMTLASFISGI